MNTLLIIFLVVHLLAGFVVGILALVEWIKDAFDKAKVYKKESYQRKTVINSFVKMFVDKYIVDKLTIKKDRVEYSIYLSSSNELSVTLRDNINSKAFKLFDITLTDVSLLTKYLTENADKIVERVNREILDYALMSVT